MTRLPVALFNYQDGGLRPDTGYDFRPLQQAFADVDETPALILFCEAKQYRDNGSRGLYMAAEALSDALGVPYVGLLGWMRRGPLPPATFYNPDLLTLRSWWHPDDPGVYDDKRNVARFAVRGSGQRSDDRAEFLAFVHHFDFRSGAARRYEAELLDRYGKEKLPVLGGGDLNSTASGDHLPQRDWMVADYRTRSHNGTLRDGVWVPDTAAVDHLIGHWDADQRRRVDGCGFHALAELAWQVDSSTPIVSTVNTGVDVGGGLLIDWLLANDAMLPHVVGDSYRVHVPIDDIPHPSDHRLVTAAIDL
ncbi:hypothetical protein [Micromonospora sp. NPDC048898]|uniref:hypothetical protein n=1 Tax=Micromonospora sp. NPDC048898 TaxID=3364260 RepID=UPI00371EA4E2